MSLYLLPGLFALIMVLDSCSALKKSTTDQTKNQDTSKVGAVSAVDSATNGITNAIGKVGKFFGSLIPEFGGKDSVILIAPRHPMHPSAEVVPPTKGDYPPSPNQRKLEFDSAGNITIHDQLLGADADVPQTYSLDQYIEQQREQNLHDGFIKEAQNYTSTSASTSTGSKTGTTGTQQNTTPGILSDYGHVEIPIPPSIVPTIFGKPSINLRVNGDVAIHLAYRDNQFLQTTGAYFNGSETGLDFRQEVNMNIQGSIGDKVKISTDFGSLRQFSFDNLFKLSYQGYPEEIIQSIEAGNVSLTTPSKYIGTQGALFGFKGVMRFGPMYLTAIAAQKKGERQTKTFGGGPGSSAGTDFIIQPANYRRNSYFLDSSYIPLFEQVYSTIPLGTGNPDVVNAASVELWRSTTNIPTGNTRPEQVKAWYDLKPIPVGQSYRAVYPQYFNNGADNLSFASGPMIKVDTSQYRVDPKTGVITLYQEPSDYDAYAVSYLLPPQTGLQFGDQAASSQDTIVLKLLKPKNLIPNAASAPSWKNLLKNTYYVGATNVDPRGFSARVAYTFPTGNVYEYVRGANKKLDKALSVMGLDRYDNATNARVPDGAFDVIGGISPLLDTRTGTLIFPYLEPFGKRILDYLAQQRRIDAKYYGDSTFYLPIIYKTAPENVRNSDAITKNNYISIDCKYSGGSSTIINLNAFNIVDGSVRVSVAGRQLQEGVDYRVDVNSGTLTLLNPDLASSGQISVEYDTHDIFTTSTKTLVGLRAEFPILDHGLIGFSLMNYSMHLPTIKTRQGEEPLSNWILGTDESYKITIPALTNWLNAIPIFNLRDKSELNFKFDAALSIPNPNTEQSPMPVDNGASIAYLDDFEGGRNEFPLSMSYARWVHSSQPIVQSYQTSGFTADQINARKSKIFWYAAQPQIVRIQDIMPNKSVASPTTFAQVMDVVFDPTNRKGIYNHSPDLTEAPENTWAGLMQYQQGLNVQSTNTDAVEFWMNLSNTDLTALPPNASFHLDMGQISEDVIPDGKLETEDKNGNGRYDPGEDNGLDTIPDAGPSTPNEQQLYGSTSADPNNDDYSYTQNSQVYDNINGTEGNSQDAVSGNVRVPDTEDLNGNSALDLDNSYYEYDIPIDPTNNPYIIGTTVHGGPNDNWYQFRIPLTSFKRTVGNLDSSFSNLQFFRLWFNGVQKPVHLSLFDIGLFGSQWGRGLVGLNPNNPAGDTSLSIDYVSVENNTGPPTNYTSPPGAARDQLAGQATVVYGNEQSLALHLRCVPDSSQREAVRIFPSPNDLFNYRSMAIWVHGDLSMPTTVTDTKNQVWVYFRFGGDKYNYYEYRRPLTRDWQNIHVDFSTLASLKATKPNYGTTVTQAANDGYFGSLYRVVGYPNVTNAPYFVLGIDNESGSNCLTTDVWFDELRLLQANDKADYAMNGSVQAKLAEFGSVTTNFIYERPDFHRVDERFNAARTLTSGWGITGEFQMNKILPSWLENRTKFPLVLSHTESLLSPKYVPNTDVEVQAAIDKISQSQTDGLITPALAKHLQDSIRLTNETLTVRNSVSATGVQFNFPGSFFLLPVFVNRLVYGFGYGEEFTRSPIYEYYRKWGWTGSIGYDLPITPPSFSPLNWVNPATFDIGRYSMYKINFLPQHLTLGANASRSRLHYINRVSTLSFFGTSNLQDTLDILNSLVPFVNRQFTMNRTMAFSWKLTENGFLSPQIDYSLDVTSNLALLETTPKPNASSYVDSTTGQVFNPYDSLYYYQRPFKAILGDIFFTHGKLVDPGKDFSAVQRFKLSTTPRLPWIFWLDKYLRPLFNYNVEYRWYDAQTGFQNDRTGQWRNTISTGVELNLRELGIDIFGGDAGGGSVKNKPGTRGGSQVERPGQPRMTPDQSLTEQGEQPVEQRRPGLRRIGDAPGQRTTPSPYQLPSPMDTIKKNAGGAPVAFKDTLHHVLGIGTEGIRDDLSVSDTVLLPVEPPELPKEEVASEPPITAKDIAKALIQKPFFDWNGTKFNFVQTNYSLNGALQGSGSGISNMLAKGIFAPEDDGNGPSRAYQLGLITDPSGRLLIKFIPTFPFIQFGVRHGLRQDNPLGRTVDINDVFTQTNMLELSTSRPLWTGASIRFNWKTSFSYDERDALRIGSNGSINPLQVMKTGDVSRTFLSIPPLPFINVSQSGIQRVGEKWDEKASAAGYVTQAQRDLMPAQLKNQLQVQSFMEGFETLPFFSGFLREYLPRLNYSFIWSGLEKFPLFSFADRASFRSAYNGGYKRVFKLNPGDVEELTTLQTITYGFRPLIAFDLGWDKIWGGRLSVTTNYDTQTDWASDYSFNRITSRLSTTIGLTANFQKAGLSVPFLKLNLKNNFGATFNFSETIASDVYYTFDNILTNLAGTANGGITKTLVEPRISYDINQQLTIEAFYRYERTTPAATGALVPPTRTITAGFDIRLKVF
ncbi:MAG TPA: cell surface protein SprA [Candidatus Kapabacteria bacterium]|nr:cell surface protein SprA [Candidatus Kapabacteria bacterium]